MQTLFAIIREMRPKQWTKNVLLFAGIVFAHRLHEPDRLALAAAAFALFCGLSSAVYIVNDLRDAEQDRHHPLKRTRPIASGALNPIAAAAVAALLGIACLAGSFAVNMHFGIIAGLYAGLMLAYSLTLKHVVIVDLMVVAIGFVMRAVAGIWAIERPGERIGITPWFITCVLFLALFIVICKRRHELVLLAADARGHRRVLEHYSTAFLDQMVNIATSATVLSYALYITAGARTGGPGGMPAIRHERMIYTLPFVLYGVFRYLFLVYKQEKGGSPEVLLFKDASLLIDIVLWGICVICIQYI